MTNGPGAAAVASTKRMALHLTLLVAALSLSGCAGTGLGGLAALKTSNTQAAGAARKVADVASAQSELQKATEYWGKKFSANPLDAKIAVNYARDLKAMGEKRRALAVLQQASILNGRSRLLASEYGRLALQLGQVNLAQKLLARAEDPARPDWRVVSARGTALAKLGRNKQALAYFERANILAPRQSSVQNNLAMAYTMDGQPQKAEVLLRKALATATPATIGRVRQNLSLVLGLQGKYDEAKAFSSKQLGATTAAANVNAIRRLVRLAPQLSPAAKADRIVQLAKAAKHKPARLAARSKRPGRSNRLALRRRKIKPAATTSIAKPSQLAQSGGPIMLRPSVHGVQ